MTFQKETIMLLKVDLDCTCCYKKVKKLLCSFPQIKDQAYNEKQNIVMIKVVCCNPEKIRDKLRCKGGKSIKEIQILDPRKTEPENPPTSKQPKQNPHRPTMPPPDQETEPTKPPRSPPKPPTKSPTKPPTKSPTKPPPNQPEQDPVHQRNTCCSDCFEGRNTGPCYNGYRNGYPYGYGPYGCEYGVVPPPPPPPPVGGRGGYYYGGFPPCGYRPCYEYVVYDNSPACVIM